MGYQSDYDMAEKDLIHQFLDNHKKQPKVSDFRKKSRYIQQHYAGQPHVRLFSTEYRWKVFAPVNRHKPTWTNDALLITSNAIIISG